MAEDVFAPFDDTKVGAFGLTRRQDAVAYAAIKERYGLKAAQRDRLDRSFDLGIILMYAHHESWAHVDLFLREEGVI